MYGDNVHKAVLKIKEKFTEFLFTLLMKYMILEKLFFNKAAKNKNETILTLYQKDSKNGISFFSKIILRNRVKTAWALKYIQMVLPKEIPEMGVMVLFCCQASTEKKYLKGLNLQLTIEWSS